MSKPFFDSRTMKVVSPEVQVFVSKSDDMCPLITAAPTTYGSPPTRSTRSTRMTSVDVLRWNWVGFAEHHHRVVFAIDLAPIRSAPGVAAHDVVPRQGSGSRCLTVEALRFSAFFGRDSAEHAPSRLAAPQDDVLHPVSSSVRRRFDVSLLVAKVDALGE